MLPGRPASSPLWANYLRSPIIKIYRNCLLPVKPSLFSFDLKEDF
jgi:hypothetical protein